MKKVNFKKVLMALTVALTFLFLGVEQANAQVNTLVGTGPSASGTSAKALMALPQGNFVSVDEAQVIIEAHLLDIKTQINSGSLPQSTINALTNQARFYTLVLTSLKTGNGVPQAIVEGTVTITTDVYGIAQSVALTLKQEAINLLKL